MGAWNRMNPPVFSGWIGNFIDYRDFMRTTGCIYQFG